MAKIDWKALVHARGPATRVPQQIKDLARPGPAADGASLQLAEALLVPGRWLATSAPAAELLVAQLTKKGASPGPLELRLLGDLAVADHLWFAMPGSSQVQANDAHARATLAIARKALPLARGWLADADASRRAAAAFFLALVEADGASADETVALARQDPRAEVRGGAALALGFHARNGHVGARAALERPSSDDVAGHWAGRVVAGLEPTPDETVEAAIAWFARWEPALLPWGRSQPLRLVKALTRALPSREALAPLLVRGAATLGPNRAETRLLCGLAVELASFTTAFGEREVVAASRLSSVQRATAEALVALPGPLLGLRHGLPGSSRATARWLGLAPSGVLEREEDGGLARWQRLREGLGEATARTTIVRDCLRGLSPAEQLEAARELLLGAYKILIEVDARWPASALAELVRAAGPAAVAWARETMAIVVELRPHASALAQLSPEHVVVVLAALVDAGEAIDPAWEPVVGFAPVAEARAVLAAIDGTRRQALVLERLARVATAEPVVRAQLLDAVAPVLDLVATPAVVGALRDQLADPTVATFVDPTNAAAIRLA